MHLDAGQDHRLAAAVEHRQRFVQALVQRRRIRRIGGRRRARAMRTHHVHHVPRQLDVAGPLVPLDGLQHAVDFVIRGDGVFQRGAGDRDPLEDLTLRGEVADAVVQQRIAFALLESGRAADHHDRRFFRIRAGHGVGQIQAAHAVGHADGAQAPHAGIGVRRKTGGVLAGRPDVLQRTVHDQVVEPQHVIARHAENVLDAAFAQLIQQVLAE